MAREFCTNCRPMTRPTCGSCPRTQVFGVKAESNLTPRARLRFMAETYWIQPKDIEEHF